MTVYSGVISTWRIVTCLDSTEYNALTDLKKDMVRMIISTGKIDFSENSFARNMLMTTIFPEGTTTHAALEAETQGADPEPPA